MSEKHTNIDDAKICEDGLNIVLGETGSDLLGFTDGLRLSPLIIFPEGTQTFKEIRIDFAYIASNPPKMRAILTRSIFVMREAHMLQKQYAYPVRWFYVKADGSFMQADSMDEIGECEQLDEEVMQADRYIDLENGLKPRTEPKPTNPETR